MKTVLCYGDSLSWGVVPGTRQRLPYLQRWTGVMHCHLGEGYHVIEECLNGRTTIFDDPARPWRHGRALLRPLLESHAPLDLVIVFLGTNDLQDVYNASAADSARGLGHIIGEIRDLAVEPRYQSPQVLVVIPPLVTRPAGAMAGKFAGAPPKSAALAAAFLAEATARGCTVFDATQHVFASPVDGVHLDPYAHLTLGVRIAEVVRELLPVAPPAVTAVPEPVAAG